MLCCQEISLIPYKCIVCLTNATGRYNYEELKIQLPSNIKFDLLDEISKDYSDYQLTLFLKFGFPLDFPKDKENQLQASKENHASAIHYNINNILTPISTKKDN